MVYYKLVKVIMDGLALAEVIIKIVGWYHGKLDAIMSDCGLVFILKFWSLLCYFFKIKQKLSTIFYLQIDG